ncbi:M24 family metallopeptidase [Peribacillus sp. ACCC06369]|nr:M24 family metallopeptidase [Peribacillus sp. ACCC06369]MDM5356638.1 M24 family metallopeptidase [Peribacillus sp. ACCC06369]
MSGVRLSNISHAIQTYVETKCFSIREYVGHGIGQDLHEDP